LMSSLENINRFDPARQQDRFYGRDNGQCLSVDSRDHKLPTIGQSLAV
jgi:hypothetical protein